jgi:hypothetical protein
LSPDPTWLPTGGLLAAFDLECQLGEVALDVSNQSAGPHDRDDRVGRLNPDLI